MNKLDFIISEIVKLIDAPGIPGSRTEEPVVSPSSVRRMSEILNVDLSEEPYQVTNIKTFLKTFMMKIRIDGRIAPDEVESCFYMIEDERLKRKLPLADFEQIDACCDKSAQIYCSECGRHATHVCVNCNDAFCSDCGLRMHSKGQRASHHINKLLPCQFCRNLPARFLCTYSFRVYCTGCMSRQTKPGLPAEILRLTPLKINYTSSKTSKYVPALLGELLSISPQLSDRGETEDNLLHLRNWHPFIDASGTLYYHNFKTQESMRRISQPPESVKEAAENHLTDQAIRKVLFARGPKYINL